MNPQILQILLFANIFRWPLNGQEIEKLNRWSVSFGYNPLYEFNLSNQLVSANDIIYWYSVSGRVSYKLSNKFSISSGVRTRKNEIDLHYDLFPNSYLTDVFWEIPIQINYYFPGHSDYFMPYCKLGLINSFLKESVNEPIDSNHSFFYISSDLGLGSEIKLNNRLYLTCEMGLGYFLKYEHVNRAYINGFLGLQYNF